MTLRRLEGKRTRWNKFYGGVNLKGTGAARSSRGARRSHFSARERGAVEGWDETGAKAGKYFGQIKSEPTSFGGQGGNWKVDLVDPIESLPQVIIWVPSQI